MDDSQVPAPNAQAPGAPISEVPASPPPPPPPEPTSVSAPAPEAQSLPTVVVPPVEQPHKSSSLPILIALVILILALGGGAYYYFVYRGSTRAGTNVLESELPGVNNQSTSPDAGFTTEETEAEDAVPTVSTSDNVNDIENEIQATDVQGAETDFQDVNTDLNSL